VCICVCVCVCVCEREREGGREGERTEAGIALSQTAHGAGGSLFTFRRSERRDVRRSTHRWVTQQRRGQVRRAGAAQKKKVSFMLPHTGLLLFSVNAAVCETKIKHGIFFFLGGVGGVGGGVAGIEAMQACSCGH